ncbi:MAG: fibronectin type III domain-containing protein [Fidelibacterota bacterium]
MKIKKIFIGLFFIALSSCSLVRTTSLQIENITPLEQKAADKAQAAFYDLRQDLFFNPVIGLARIDSIEVNQHNRNIQLFFNKELSYLPFRVKNVDKLYQTLYEGLGWRFRKYSLEIFTIKTPVEQLVPNFFRDDTTAIDYSRIPYPDRDDIPLVRRKNWKVAPTHGLNQKHIALWHSHGWYYSNSMDRWEWQRPRLFQTVEDLFPFAFVVPYLAPMLENAGANVFLPRERDWQTEEVIVDNDSSQYNSLYREIVNQDHKPEMGEEKGFALGLAPYTTGENPFENGSYRVFPATADTSLKIQWIPDIPEDGKYAVYISFHHSPENVSDASYRVFHLGGETEFLINQKMGGKTWIYLGKFMFAKGVNQATGRVELASNSETPGAMITADAVRFGGGMGDVKRGNSISHRPRFVEGARYYLQYAGMPDTLIYHMNDNKNDYNDDYTSRGEWVNYMTGAPNGPNKDRDNAGLGIPIDLSFSFHTDAGINDKQVVGTLSIYSLQDIRDNIRFPKGYSRLANRDYADIVQTQIVEDARQLYDPSWARRSLYIGKYSEAYRPNVPSMLLELLSHQNFLDMKFGLNPNFRFDISRSIYKGMLKYLASSHDFEYIVQPLPVDHFQATFTGQQEVTLRWKPVMDKLEPTAKPEKYILYTRIDSMDFDNGILVDGPEYIFADMEPGVQYSFKVTAVNQGGESFPSEILSACWVENAKDRVLIVNNFDRISAAETVRQGNFHGFTNFYDEGVPDKYDIGFTGTQHDFDRDSKWLTNDYPGWGASHGNYETRIIAGNSFDYPYIHGKSLVANGYSYVSASDEAVENGDLSLLDYTLVNMIYGEEKSTPYSPKIDSTVYPVFTPKMMKHITDYCNNGGNMIMTGAYLGSDNFATPLDSSEYTDFARNILKYNYGTDHAAKSGEFYTAGEKRQLFHYNNRFSDKIYKLEAPDAIAPARDSGAEMLLRFCDNEFGAGIWYRGNYGLVISTVPFETVQSQAGRDRLMSIFLNKLNNQ